MIVSGINCLNWTLFTTSSIELNSSRLQETSFLSNYFNTSGHAARCPHHKSAFVWRGGSYFFESFVLLMCHNGVHVCISFVHTQQIMQRQIFRQTRGDLFVLSYRDSKFTIAGLPSKYTSRKRLLLNIQCLCSLQPFSSFAALAHECLSCK